MEDFVREFLFGDSGIRRDGAGVAAEIRMDPNKEGWIGIPHGGISMGAIVDLYEFLRAGCGEECSAFPFTVDFRMGGAQVRVGDTVRAEVLLSDAGAKGIINAGPGLSPYLKAAIRTAPAEEFPETSLIDYLPSSLSGMESLWLPLPFYRNCFVCGIERKQIGLQRQFQYLDTGTRGRLVLARAGLDVGDGETFFRFKRDGAVHPVALLALLDETMGWAGFMITESGAVTVRLNATFRREIRVEEKLLFFGRGEKTRGSGSRMFFWASGGVAAVKGDGTLEIVMTATGQWLGIPELTEQMRAELLPQELTKRAFEIAGSKLVTRGR